MKHSLLLQLVALVLSAVLATDHALASSVHTRRNLSDEDLVDGWEDEAETEAIQIDPEITEIDVSAGFTKTPMYLDAGRIVLSGPSVWVQFDQIFPVPPTVHVVISTIQVTSSSLDGNTVEFFNVTASGVDISGFWADFAGGELEGRSTVTASYVAYVGTEEANLLSGRYELLRDNSVKTNALNWNTLEGHVDFDRELTSPPNVTVSLCGVMVSDTIHPQLRSHVKQVTSTGFDFSVTWAQTSGLMAAEVAWLAVPNHKVFNDVIAQGEAVLEQDSESWLPGNEFLSAAVPIPSDAIVVLGLAGVDVTKGLSVVIEPEVAQSAANITVEAMWETRLFSADVAWTAVNTGSVSLLVDDAEPVFGAAQGIAVISDEQPNGEGDPQLVEDSVSHSVVWVIVGVGVIVPALAIASVIGYRRMGSPSPTRGHNVEPRDSEMPILPGLGGLGMEMGPLKGKGKDGAGVGAGTTQQQHNDPVGVEVAPAAKPPQSQAPATLTASGSSSSLRRSASPRLSPRMAESKQAGQISANNVPNMKLASPTRPPSALSSREPEKELRRRLHRASQAMKPETKSKLTEMTVEANKVAHQQQKELSEDAGYQSIAKMIRSKGKQVVNAMDVRGYGLLHYAVGRQHSKSVTLLLSNGSNCDLKDCHGNTALHWAVTTRNAGIARQLIQAKADVNARNNSGQAPIHIAAREGLEEITSLLLGAGAKVKVADGLHKTPIHHAAVCNKLAVLQMFVEAEPAIAFLDFRDKEGCSALAHAVRLGHREATAFLVGAGAKVNCPDRNQYTPLMWAAAQGCLQIVTRLVTEDPEIVNLQNVKGETCLHLAAHGGHLEICRVLATYKADPHMEDAQGRTPLQRAVADRAKELKEVFDNCFSMQNGV